MRATSPPPSHYGREHGLPIAVRAGGHSGAGYGVVDDGLVIDVRPMQRIEVDLAARTARVRAPGSPGRSSTPRPRRTGSR